MPKTKTKNPTGSNMESLIPKNKSIVPKRKSIVNNNTFNNLRKYELISLNTSSNTDAINFVPIKTSTRGKYSTSSTKRAKKVKNELNRLKYSIKSLSEKLEKLKSEKVKIEEQLKVFNQISQVEKKIKKINQSAKNTKFKTRTSGELSSKEILKKLKELKEKYSIISNFENILSNYEKKINSYKSENYQNYSIKGIKNLVSTLNNKSRKLNGISGGLRNNHFNQAKVKKGILEYKFNQLNQESKNKRERIEYLNRISKGIGTEEMFKKFNDYEGNTDNDKSGPKLFVNDTNHSDERLKYGYNLPDEEINKVRNKKSEKEFKELWKKHGKKLSSKLKNYFNDNGYVKNEYKIEPKKVFEFNFNSIGAGKPLLKILKDIDRIEESKNALAESLGVAFA